MTGIAKGATPATAGCNPLDSDQLGDSINPSDTPAESIPQNRRAYLLAELRCAALRARLWQLDIDAVGIALNGSLITLEQALELLHDCDALHFVGAPEGAGA
jgi:hypothetical protein